MVKSWVDNYIHAFHGSEPSSEGIADAEIFCFIWVLKVVGESLVVDNQKVLLQDFVYLIPVGGSEKGSIDLWSLG